MGVPTVAQAGPPERLGRYRLVRKLGDGGMGEIHLAWFEGVEGFRKPCVVKVLRPDLAKDARVAEMFLDEARLVAELHHPNIVQVYDLGRVDDRYFIAMEYVAGEPLSLLVRASRGRRVPIAIDVALRIAAGVCTGLHHAHCHRDQARDVRGIVHRDVSPHNVMLSYDGTPRLIDFGIARALRGQARRSDHTTDGKVPYMAPELISGEAASVRTDVYAVGVLLYELLAAVRPFRGDDMRSIAEAVLRARPTPVGVARGDLPADVAALVENAMAADPARRPESAAELAERCEEVLFHNRWMTTPRRVAAHIAEILGPEWAPATLDRTVTHLDEILELEERRTRAITALGPRHEEMEAPTAELARADAATVSSVRSKGPLERRSLPLAAALVALVFAAAGAVIALLAWPAPERAAVRPPREAVTPRPAAATPPEPAEPASAEPAPSPGVQAPAPPSAEIDSLGARGARGGSAEPRAPEERAGSSEVREREPRARGATKRAPAAPAIVRVRVLAQPDCMLYVDGRRIGLTHQYLELPAGAHQLRCVNDSLGAAARERITLRPAPGDRVQVIRLHPRAGP